MGERDTDSPAATEIPAVVPLSSPLERRRREIMLAPVILALHITLFSGEGVGRKTKERG